MSPAFNPLTHLRRFHQARRLRQGSGHQLPAWALGEIKLSPAQAAWLMRSVCSWHALPRRGAAAVGCPADGAAVPLVDLMVRLADQGL